MRRDTTFSAAGQGPAADRFALEAQAVKGKGRSVSFHLGPAGALPPGRQRGRRPTHGTAGELPEINRMGERIQPLQTICGGDSGATAADCAPRRAGGAAPTGTSGSFAASARTWPGPRCACRHPGSRSRRGAPRGKEGASRPRFTPGAALRPAGTGAGAAAAGGRGPAPQGAGGRPPSRAGAPAPPAAALQAASGRKQGGRTGGRTGQAADGGYGPVRGWPARARAGRTGSPGATAGRRPAGAPQACRRATCASRHGGRSVGAP
jgi:hypothetical protein